MFEKGTAVMHSGMGVCRITDIKTRDFCGKKKEFYILKPVYENTGTTIYLPVDKGASLLRELFTADDIENALKNVSAENSLWIENEASRKEEFSEIIKSKDYSKIICLLKELHEHRISLEKGGKHLRVFDGKILKEAERIIHQEIAYIMNLDIAEVKDFIIKKINNISD